MSDTPAFDLWKAAGDVVECMDSANWQNPLRQGIAVDDLIDALEALREAWAAFAPFSAFPPSDPLTLPQAAAFLSSLGKPRTAGTLRKAIARGLLSAKKVGRDWTVTTQDLLDYLKQPAPEDTPEPI